MKGYHKKKALAGFVKCANVGVSEIRKIRAGHCDAAGVLRHAALAVVGIVGNHSDNIVYDRIRSAETAR